MKHNDWKTTPHEALLDAIYEGLVAYTDEFVPDIYGATLDRPKALLYVEDSEGKCWKILAEPHDHSRCKCGRLMSMHYDSRDENRPSNAIVSHPGTIEE